MTRGKGPSHGEDDEVDAAKVRLDKWLWAARFFKTRVLAAEAVDGGKVDVNDDRAKRAKLVGVGDQVRLRNGPVEWHLIIRGVAARRGPAEIAKLLYEEMEEGRKRREAIQLSMRAAASVFSFGDSRPGKHERQAIRRMRAINKYQHIFLT